MWESIGTLPTSIGEYGCAVVYHGEIHVIDRGTYHYKYDGTTWTNVGRVVNSDRKCSAVVYNDEIHLMANRYHYKFDGTKWSGVAEVVNTNYVVLTVYNNEIHLFDGTIGNSVKLHYKYDGITWTNVGTGECLDAVVYRGDLIAIRSTDMCKFNSDYSLTYIIDMPIKIQNARWNSIIVHNDEIHLLGNSNHYKFDGTSWTSVSTLPYNFYWGGSVSFNDSIMLLGTYNEVYFYKFTTIENIFSPYTLILQRGVNGGVYLTAFTNLPIEGENNRFISGFDDVYFFGSTAFELNDEMYYGNGTQWIKFKN